MKTALFFKVSRLWSDLLATNQMSSGCRRHAVCHTLVKVQNLAFARGPAISYFILNGLACLCLLVAMMFCTTACAGPSTKMKEQHSISGGDQTQASTKLSLKKPATLYLADFNLEPSIMTSSREHRNNLVRRVLPKSRHDDPGEKSKKLVAVLSDSIRAELESGGQHTLKINGKVNPQNGLPQDTTLPEDGWLIGGWFVKVDEGDRVMQSAVGFGAGAEKVELIVLVTDLSNKSAGPFLTIGSENGKKKVPGAILMMNPYMLAAKFVLSSKTTERDTKKIGKSIADNLLDYIKSLPAEPN